MVLWRNAITLYLKETGQIGQAKSVCRRCADGRVGEAGASRMERAHCAIQVLKNSCCVMPADMFADLNRAASILNIGKNM